MPVHRKSYPPPTPSITIVGTHLYTCVKRDNVELSFLSKETTRWQGPGSKHRSQDRKSNALTTKTTALHARSSYNNLYFRNIVSSVSNSRCLCLFITQKITVRWIIRYLGDLISEQWPLFPRQKMYPSLISHLNSA